MKTLKTIIRDIDRNTDALLSFACKCGQHRFEHEPLYVIVSDDCASVYYPPAARAALAYMLGADNWFDRGNYIYKEFACLKVLVAKQLVSEQKPRRIAPEEMVATKG